MQQEIDGLLAQANAEIDAIEDSEDLEKLRVHYLGKKGLITELLKSVSALPKSERPVIGQTINAAKKVIVQQIKQQQERLMQVKLQASLIKEKIDVSLPGCGERLGSMHPVTRVKQRVVELFKSLGFSVEEGPDIEDDYHNFTALNIPQHHPARALQDTFYLQDDYLLRTHTSPVQIRTMEHASPPFRIITPGRVYRCDSDQTHTPMFHQCEGLLVDEHCTFSSLKGLLHDFLSRFFESAIELRFRPSYFPFTEPSAEVDIRRLDEDGRPMNDWLEVLGCGMVHPNVLRNVNIDPDQFTGFAFGVGLDRLAMLRYRIHDLRTMFENDLRFLQQF
mgnify:CR=1 FL=1